MKAFSISIPKPCHEDWSKMTPDEKGAFCASCQKSVYDFSKKTDEEIIAVFEKEEKGKVCGRFSTAQLSRPVVTFGNQTATRQLAKFAYALLLVFGAFLFNGNVFGQEMVKGETRLMGKPSVEHYVVDKEVEKVDEPITKGTPITCGLRTVKDVNLTSLGQAVVMEEPTEIIRMGDTVVAPVKGIDKVSNLVETAITGDKNIEVKEYYDIPLGMMVMEPIDTVALIEPEIIEPIENVEIVTMVAGGVSYVEYEVPELTPVEDVEGQLVEETEEVIPTEDVISLIDILETPPVNDEVIPKEEVTLVEEVVPVEEEETDKTGLVLDNLILPVSQLEVKVFPNPSAGQISLSYNLDNNSAVNIELFDITGKRVKTLTNLGRQYAGKYNVSYNISDLPNGIYMATLSTDTNKVSSKVILTK